MFAAVAGTHVEADVPLTIHSNRRLPSRDWLDLRLCLAAQRCFPLPAWCPPAVRSPRHPPPCRLSHSMPSSRATTIPSSFPRWMKPRASRFKRRTGRWVDLGAGGALSGRWVVWTNPQPRTQWTSLHYGRTHEASSVHSCMTLFKNEHIRVPDSGDQKVGTQVWTGTTYARTHE